MRYLVWVVLASALLFGCHHIGNLDMDAGPDTDADSDSDTDTDTDTDTDSCGSVVLEGGSNVASKEDLDALEGITHIKGRLRIEGSDFTDLHQLSDLRCVDESLDIYGASGLSNLYGLGSLIQVGDGFRVGVLDSANDNLVSVDGLDSLTSVGSLHVLENNCLLNLDGLSQLQFISESLDIRYNEAIEDVSALLGVVISPGVYLHIMYNDCLPQDQADALENSVYSTGFQGDSFVHTNGYSCSPDCDDQWNQ